MMTQDVHEHTGDMMLPREIASQAEIVGERKVKTGASELFALAILGGAYIALGATFSTTVLAGMEGSVPYGISRLLAGLTFSLGLIAIVLGGAELFTGNALMVMAFAARKITLTQVLRAWGIVYAGNLVGALSIAILVSLSGQYLMGNLAVAKVVLRIALEKSSLPFVQSMILGILCNVLVCLSVWLSLGTRSAAGKTLAILFPVTAFVASGFEHSIANMYFIPVGMLVRDLLTPEQWQGLGNGFSAYSTITWPGFLVKLIPVTLGNMVGGGGLFALVYWFIYLRHR